MLGSNLLQLFTDGIQAACACSEWDIECPRQHVPLDCQVFSVGSALVISDGIHTVPCDFTMDALVRFKKDNPTTNLRRLKGRRLVLKDFAPHTSLLPSFELGLSLRVYSFALASLGRLPRAIVGSPAPLSASPEMQPVIELARKRLLKRAIDVKDGVNRLPMLEEILSPGMQEHLGEVVVCVNDEKEGGEAQTALGEQLVDYANIEAVEKEAIATAAKLKEEEKARRRKRATLRVAPECVLVQRKDTQLDPALAQLNGSPKEFHKIEMKLARKAFYVASEDHLLETAETPEISEDQKQKAPDDLPPKKPLPKKAKSAT